MPRNNRCFPTLKELQKRTKQAGGCWEWTGDKTQRGYGRIMRTLNGKQVTLRVHRIAFEIFNGPIPEGQNILHRCDNPPCWNPSHLVAGTQAENMADMFAKGRCTLGWKSVRVNPPADVTAKGGTDHA